MVLLALVLGVVGCEGKIGGGLESDQAEQPPNPTEPVDPSDEPDDPSDGPGGPPDNPIDPPDDPIDPPEDPVDPGPTTGLEHWMASCVQCHGTFPSESEVSTGDANGDFILDASAAVARRGDRLAQYINDAMPLLSAENCVGGCASATDEYIRAQVRPSSDPPDDPVDPPDDPAPATGLEHWMASCVQCHGTFPVGSGISTGNANGDFRLDAAAAVARRGDQLTQYIIDTMPFLSAADCVGDCASGTDEYIRSQLQPVEAPNCAEEVGQAYGVREMRLLSSSEYQRSLEDLLGAASGFGDQVANNDGSLGGFPNMRGKTVNGSTLETYISNAETIATWAVANDRPFACTGTTACARRFIDEFLFRAFRGPVSDEQRTSYTSLFETYPAEGMRLALEAALTSPLFLYRAEAGVDLQTAIDRGYYTNTGAPNGAPVEVIESSSFPTGSGRLEGDEWLFTTNGAVEVRFGAAFESTTTVRVEARGTNHGAIWPELTVRVGGALIGTQSVSSNTRDTYQFVVQGQSGTSTVRLEFNNDSGEPPYGPGQDANLYIARVALVTASSPGPAPDEESPLQGADPNAFVLTPYELASALSFMLTGSTPDLPLLEAAAADLLTTRAQVRAQVERLIDSPRGRQHVGDFVTSWFKLDDVKDAARPDVPAFTPDVKDAMVREVREHFAHVFYSPEVPYSEFFGGNYTFLNRTLADFYGVSGAFDSSFVRAEVPGRGGPIASGAFMAANAHVERSAPILRAVHARQAALCHYIDPPNSPIAGDDIDEQRAAAQARVEEREREQGVLSSREFYFLYTDGIDACAGCHETIINPMFGMEDFDNVGRSRPAAGAGMVTETVRGTETPVSIEGTLIGVETVSDGNVITYAGAKDFSNKIARTGAVQTCLVRKGFRYLTGLAYLDRDLDTANQESLSEEQRTTYGCVASRLTEVLSESGESPRAMFIELATENLLRLRR